ncbi:MAG: rane protein of unknown function [Candidatus Saccharibacteria bacterium]|nr:rane protein of unknown function [Candidatus Saccharibacteria bacterium]
MKRLLLIFTALVTLLTPSLAVAGSASAVGLFGDVCKNAPADNRPDVCTDTQSQDVNGENPIIHIISIALNVISIIAGIMAVIGLIVAGLRFVTANGDPSGAKSARETVVYSLVGIIVIVVSQSIIGFVLNRIG